MVSDAETSRAAQPIPVANAWYLLLYAWDLARWGNEFQSDSEVAPDLVSLLAKVLVRSCQKLMREQLGREFQLCNREIRGLRGKLDITASLKKDTFRHGQSICRFNELSIDTPRNRILRATLDFLSRDALDAGNSSSDVSTLRHELRLATRLMEGVKIVRLQGSDFSRLQLGRNDRLYRLPLAICSLLHFTRMPSERQGDRLLAGLLRSEIDFADLFERFVRNFYRAHLGNCNVHRENLSWRAEAASASIPLMSTDTTIEPRSYVSWRVVVDTKYYRDYLTSNRDWHGKFHSGHLYQMYAYLRTQEDRGGAFQKASGLLLYPVVRGSINEAFRVQGHAIRIATIDLSKPWQDIDHNLLALAAEATRDAGGAM